MLSIWATPWIDWRLPGVNGCQEGYVLNPLHPRLVALKNVLVMQDTTFEMEKRRNRPEKYNRELVHKTVKAMERISEVRFMESLLA